MAAINIEPIFKPGRVRPAHFQDAIDIWTGSDEDSYQVSDQSTVITQLKSDQNALINALETTVNGQKASTVTAINNLIQALIDTPPEDETAWLAAMAQLKIDQESAVNTGISPNYAQLKTDLQDEVDSNIPATVSVNKSTVLTSVKSDLVTAIENYNSGQFAFVDQKCGGAGRHPAYLDAEEDPTNTVEKHCSGCDGLGRTETSNTPSVTFPVTTTFSLT